MTGPPAACDCAELVNVMLTVTRLLAIAIMPLAATSFGVPGLVACLGADGDFALEVGDEAGCLCVSGDHGEESEAIHQATLSPDADKDADCLCLPFSSDWRATVAGLKHDYSPKQTVPQPYTAIAFNDRKLAGWDLRGFLDRDVHSPPPFFRLALRTIVLLT